MRAVCRKGFLFSIVTFMLLFSVLMFVRTMHERTSMFDKLSSITYSGSHLAYIHDDISQNTYRDLISVNASGILSNSTGSTLSITGGFLGLDDAPPDLLTEYSEYITQNYSLETGIDISVEGLTPSAIIEPYNIRYTINESRSHLIPANGSQIVGMTIIASVDRSSSDVSLNISPIDSGSIPLRVILLDKDGYHLLTDESASLSPSAAPGEFLAVFDDGSSISVRFGLIDGNQGALEIFGNGLITEVNLIRLELAPPADNHRIRVLGGEPAIVSVASRAYAMSKRAPIVIAEEKDI